MQLSPQGLYRAPAFIKSSHKVRSGSYVDSDPSGAFSASIADHEIQRYRRSQRQQAPSAPTVRSIASICRVAAVCSLQEKRNRDTEAAPWLAAHSQLKSACPYATY